MYKTVDKSNASIQLRKKAEAHIQAGTTPITGYWSIGVDALRMLHRLSSNPDNAGDALKLLHELQVHQVELDLQNEEIAANERALVEDLDHYRTLYDSVPFAYFVVDFKGTVIHSNLAAAELFGVVQYDLEGQRIETLLNPSNRPLLLDLLERVAASGIKNSCVARIGGTQGSRELQFMASISPDRTYFLLACCECANSGLTAINPRAPWKL